MKIIGLIGGMRWESSLENNHFLTLFDTTRIHALAAVQFALQA